MKCCAPAFSGTMAAQRRSAERWRPRPEAARRSPATSPCPASPRPSSCGCARTSPRYLPRIATVLLPKAYAAARLSGETRSTRCPTRPARFGSTSARARWSEPLLAATGLDSAHMPALGRGHRSRRAGCARSSPRLGHGAARRSSRAARATMPPAPSALGAVRAGDAFLSIGTSGVLWATTAGFRPTPPGRACVLPRPAGHLAPDGRAAFGRGRRLAWWAKRHRAGDGRAARGSRPPRTPAAPLLVPAVPVGRAHAAQRRRVRGGFVRPRPRRYDRRATDASGARRRRLRLSRWAGRACRGRHRLERAPRHRRRRTLALLWSQILADRAGDCRCQPDGSGEHGRAFGAARLARMAAIGREAVASHHVCAPSSPTRNRHADTPNHLPAGSRSTSAYAGRHNFLWTSAIMTTHPGHALRTAIFSFNKPDRVPRHRLQPPSRRAVRLPLLRQGPDRARQAHGGASALCRLLLAQLRWPGTDPFGGDTFSGPGCATAIRWTKRRRKADVAFELFASLGRSFLHLPRPRCRAGGRNLAETNRNLRAIAEVFASKMDETRRQPAVGHRQPLLPPPLHGGRGDQSRSRRLRLRRGAGEARARGHPRAGRRQLRAVGRARRLRDAAQHRPEARARPARPLPATWSSSTSTRSASRARS